MLAGIGAGLVGAMTGLASLVSYPALLAVGLPPLTANVTNSIAMVGTTIGAAAGSRPELTGQRDQVLKLCAITAAGGISGAVLLLVTPPGMFTLVVPWLIAAASVLLLFAPKLRALAARSDGVGLGPLTGLAAFGVAVYCGYFGAAAGVLMLALLSVIWAQSLARSNAAKNLATGAANLIAAVLFAFTGKVDWPAALTLCAGSTIGAWLGPALVRRLPATPLRIVIAIAGLGLAVSLAVR